MRKKKFKVILAILISCMIVCTNSGFNALGENTAVYAKSSSTKPYITFSERNCEVGDKFYIKLKGTKTKSYTIEDETVATVSKKGKVKTKRAGKTKLTILGADGKNYTCKINVYDTNRCKDAVTIKSESSKATAAIRASDVPTEDFSVSRGILVNFNNILFTDGTPEGLVYLKKSKVTSKLTYKDSDCRLQAEVIKPLSKMLEAAYDEGKFKYTIIAGGGYREFATQDRYWQRRQAMYPGYADDPYNNGGVICVPPAASEHRTGFAVDFDATKEGFEWLKENCYKYGFIHRYEGDKTIYTGVMDEDEHYSYVGKDIAATCHYEGLCLEEYYEKYVNVDVVTEITTPFMRMDRDDPQEWKTGLDNLRLVTGNLYKFKKTDKKFEIDKNYVPTKEGLDTLNISGSAQFSVPQFKELTETLKACAGEKTIYIIDLRQESHVFVNKGIPISWYGSNNWANAGLSLKEIEADEASRFGSLLGEKISVYGRDGEKVKNETRITINSFITEKELVEGEGYNYLRLPIQDHTWPDAETIDTFIDFVKSIDTDNVWLHFHCQAGKGRTGIMMMIYDMMKNPDLPLNDIVVRQTMLGGGYPFYVEKTETKKLAYHKEKAKMTPIIYEYIRDQHENNYEVSWSQWLENYPGL